MLATYLILFLTFSHLDITNQTENASQISAAILRSKTWLEMATYLEIVGIIKAKLKSAQMHSFKATRSKLCFFRLFWLFLNTVH